MCCNSGSSNQQSTTVSPQIPSWYLDAAKGLTSRAEWESLKNYQPYTGPRVAGFNDDQQDAFAATRANQGAYGQGLSSAYSQTAQGAQGFPSANLDAYMSPYQQNVIDIAKREAIRSDDIARQGRNASAVGAGAFGGSRAALVEAEAGRNLGQNLSDIQMTGSQAAFNQAANQFNADQQRSLAAGAQFGQLGGLSQQYGLRDAAALETIGATQQGQEQRNLDTAYGDFLEQRGFPGQQLNFLSSILRGTNPQGLYPTQTTTQLPSASLAGQIGGLGTAGLGIYGMGKGLGWFARGGRVNRPLTNYAKGGQVRRYAGGGLADLSTQELTLIQRDYMRRRDPRLPAVNEEIFRRRNVNPAMTPGKPGGGLSALAATFGNTRREQEIEEATAGLAGDRDLEGIRRHPSMVEEQVGRPLPQPPKPRPTVGGQYNTATEDRRATEDIGFEASRDVMLSENSSNAYVPYNNNPDTSNGGGLGDEMIDETRRVGNSTPYHPPTPKAPKEFDSAPWEALAAAGFRMAEAGSRPGATLAGSIGAGGSEGIRHLQSARKEKRENRELDIRENRDKALEDINRKELELKRQIELDPNSPKVARLQQDIEESKAKVATIYPAQAKYYEGLAKRVAEKAGNLYTIIPGENGEAIGITIEGEKKPLGIPYSKMKPQMSDSEVRMKALQMVTELEAKGTVMTPEDFQRRLREAEHYIREGSGAPAVKRYNPETRKLE